ncbi:hypothetical protein IKI14_04090 [bacterium]|nr:hypothetical protein [bacterium]
MFTLVALGLLNLSHRNNLDTIVPNSALSNNLFGLKFFIYIHINHNAHDFCAYFFVSTDSHSFSSSHRLHWLGIFDGVVLHKTFSEKSTTNFAISHLLIYPLGSASSRDSHVVIQLSKAQRYTFIKSSKSIFHESDFPSFLSSEFLSCFVSQLSDFELSSDFLSSSDLSFQSLSFLSFEIELHLLQYQLEPSFSHFAVIVIFSAGIFSGISGSHHKNLYQFLSGSCGLATSEL